MHKELEKFDNWIAALRSGAYTQGRSSLKSSPHGKPLHCCLGVLCEMSDEFEEIDEGLHDKWGEKCLSFQSTTIKRANRFYLPLSSTGTLEYFLKHAVTDNLTDELKDDPEGEIASRNDQGESFAEIAVFLETEIRPVFEQYINDKQSKV